VPSAETLGLEEGDLPSGFHQEFPGHAPDTSTGKYNADNLDLCKALGQSSRRGGAMNNSTSLAILSVQCWLLVQWPRFDFTGATVKKRDIIPNWVDTYWQIYWDDENMTDLAMSGRMFPESWDAEDSESFPNRMPQLELGQLEDAEMNGDGDKEDPFDIEDFIRFAVLG
jgi:hypothetical protein